VTSQARPPVLFTVGRNPQDDSKLPFLLRLPLDGGLVLKARDVWPTTARVYCHIYEEEWSDGIEIVEETPVLLCRRRGGAIDLLLDRPRLARSQFVFTRVKGREAIFWQTQKTARAANPGGRIPRRRSLTRTVTITVDTRERYPYKFSQHPRRDGPGDRHRRRLRHPRPGRNDHRGRRTENPRQPRRHALRWNTRVPDATPFRTATRCRRHRGQILRPVQARTR